MKSLFVVSDEGEHTIEFYSVDNDENVEEIKTITFHIDKTLLEEKIEFKPQEKEVEVLGIDENQTQVIFDESRKESDSDL